MSQKLVFTAALSSHNTTFSEPCFSHSLASQWGNTK